MLLLNNVKHGMVFPVIDCRNAWIFFGGVFRTPMDPSYWQSLCVSGFMLHSSTLTWMYTIHHESRSEKIRNLISLLQGDLQEESRRCWTASFYHSFSIFLLDSDCTFLYSFSFAVILTTGKSKIQHTNNFHKICPACFPWKKDFWLKKPVVKWSTSQ